MKDVEVYIELSNSYGYGSNLDINEITVEIVKRKIDEVLGSAMSELHNEIELKMEYNA